MGNGYGLVGRKYYQWWYNRSLGTILRNIKFGANPLNAVLKQSSKYPKSFRQYYANEFMLSLVKKGLI